MIPHSTASTLEPSEEAVQKEKVIERQKKRKEATTVSFVTQQLKGGHGLRIIKSLA